MICAVQNVVSLGVCVDAAVVDLQHSSGSIRSDIKGTYKRVHCVSLAEAR